MAESSGVLVSGLPRGFGGSPAARIVQPCGSPDSLATFRPTGPRGAVQLQHHPGAPFPPIYPAVRHIDQSLAAGFDGKVQIIQGPAADYQYDTRSMHRTGDTPKCSLISTEDPLNHRMGRGHFRPDAFEFPLHSDHFHPPQSWPTRPVVLQPDIENGRGSRPAVTVVHIHPVPLVGP